MTKPSSPGTGPTKEEREQIKDLLNKMVRLKILKEDENIDINEADRIKFTEQFERHFDKIGRRLDADPETHSESFDISAGMRSVLLNYFEDKKIITEIGEDELYDIGVMVYTLKMMKAGKDPADITGEPN
jgi:hypothetical protein